MGFFYFSIDVSDIFESKLYELEVVDISVLVDERRLLQERDVHTKQGLLFLFHCCQLHHSGELKVVGVG